ncbi:hypothetical protein QTP86_008881 [Hemibagrus guttatus]|nr:hypothetical protein QTP86_008881 [Hemibagrus guttatus]
MEFPLPTSTLALDILESNKYQGWPIRQGSAGGPTVDPCRPGFSQNFYTVFIPREQLQGQSIVKALTHRGMDSTRALKVCCGIWHQNVSSRSFKSCASNILTEMKKNKLKVTAAADPALPRSPCRQKTSALEGTLLSSAHDVSSFHNMIMSSLTLARLDIFHANASLWLEYDCD